MVQVKPITLNIDQELWTNFKATVTRDRTLNEAVVQLIQEHIERSKSKKNES